MDFINRIYKPLPISEYRLKGAYERWLKTKPDDYHFYLADGTELNCEDSEKFLLCGCTCKHFTPNRYYLEACDAHCQYKVNLKKYLKEGT